MERDIKFRGKRIDSGEWVYGSFVIYPSYKGEWTKSSEIWNFDSKGEHYWVVNPETVGQFTGVKDKNGVEIYEGDVVIFGKLSTVIKYFDKYGMFGLVGKSQYRKYDENEPMGSGGSSTSYKPYVLSEYYQKRIEVIGNIHDKAQQKQALIDMMRGDEEIGLYNDNPKNH